jgi:CDP-diacylglycerol pyrophosphatase
MAVAAGWALSLDRKTLWPVVRACVATYKLSRLPYPCLEVDLSRGEAGGFVVLRPPVGPPDTILSPTRHLTGVEDPFLQSPDSPNYFADAWNARGFVGEGRDGPPPDRVGLVVNPLSLRSQDQLHIHIGCLFPEIRAEIDAFAGVASVGVWRRPGRAMPSFWGFRTGRSDLTGIDPFRIAAEKFGADVGHRAHMAILVAQARGEFIIFVNTPHSPGLWTPMGADDTLDLACRDEPTLSPK